MSIPAGIASKIPFNRFKGTMNGWEGTFGVFDGTSNSVGHEGNTITVNNLSESGTMWGTPFNNEYFTNDSAFNRVAQHSVRNLDDWNSLVAKGDSVFMDIQAFTSQVTTGLNRNGYTSLSFTAFSSTYFTQFRYWSYFDNRATFFNGQTTYFPFF